MNYSSEVFHHQLPEFQSLKDLFKAPTTHLEYWLICDQHFLLLLINSSWRIFTLPCILRFKTFKVTWSDTNTQSQKVVQHTAQCNSEPLSPRCISLYSWFLVALVAPACRCPVQNQIQMCFQKPSPSSSVKVRVLACWRSFLSLHMGFILPNKIVQNQICLKFGKSLSVCKAYTHCKIPHTPIPASPHQCHCDEHFTVAK